MSGFDILSYKQTVAPNFLAIYGREKAGKTSTLVSTINEMFGDAVLEKDAKMHIIDVDHGLESFINRWAAKGKPVDEVTDKNGGKRLVIPNVDVRTVDSQEEFHDAIWVLPEGFQYYVVDSFTRAGKYFIKSVQPKKSPGERSKNANMDVAFLFEDYIDRMEELAWQLNRRGAWLIVVCHEKHTPGSRDGTQMERIEPLLYGSAAGKLMRIVTGYWRLQVVDVQTGTGWVQGRQFRTAQTEVILAGDRSGALDETEPANIARCIRKIKDARAAGIPSKENT